LLFCWWACGCEVGEREGVCVSGCGRRVGWGAMDLLDIPSMHDHDRYELVKDIGSGNFGVARLMRDKVTRELVAVKYIERGEKVRGCFLGDLRG
jgi:hypothetical protein